jgi:hypothetical protein
MPRGTIQVQSVPAPYARPAETSRGARRLPVGYGLLIAAGLSASLWIGAARLVLGLVG